MWLSQNGLRCQVCAEHQHMDLCLFSRCHSNTCAAASSTVRQNIWRRNGTSLSPLAARLFCNTITQGRPHAATLFKKHNDGVAILYNRLTCTTRLQQKDTSCFFWFTFPYLCISYLVVRFSVWLVAASMTVDARKPQFKRSLFLKPWG